MANNLWNRVSIPNGVKIWYAVVLDLEGRVSTHFSYNIAKKEDFINELEDYKLQLASTIYIADVYHIKERVEYLKDTLCGKMPTWQCASIDDSDAWSVIEPHWFKDCSYRRKPEIVTSTFWTCLVRDSAYPKSIPFSKTYDASDTKRCFNNPEKWEEYLRYQGYKIVSDVHIDTIIKEMS